MTFDEFSALYHRLYNAHNGRDPFAITVRRAFNRMRHLPAPSVVVAITNELTA